MSDQQKSIDLGLQHIEKSLEHLGQAHELLAKRLEPLLNDDTDEARPAAEAQSWDGVCSLAHRLHDIANNIGSRVTELEMMIDRLGI